MRPPERSSTSASLGFTDSFKLTLWGCGANPLTLERKSARCQQVAETRPDERMGRFPQTLTVGPIRDSRQKLILHQDKGLLKL